MMRGFALIELDEGRRAGDAPILGQKIQAVKDLPSRSDWPSGASIVDPNELRGIKQLYGREHIPRYKLHVQVEARDEDQLKQVFAIMERLCHVDGFGG